MKWTAFLLVVLAAMVVVLPSITVAASAGTVAIESISHAVTSEASEQLSFKLSEQMTPKIFTMKGENPRLVLDFPNSKYRGKAIIPLAEGKLATAIRTGSHQEPEQKIRVVVDLAKEFTVSHSSRYVDADHLLVVELSADLQAQPIKAEGWGAQEKSTAPPPQQDVTFVKPRVEEPVEKEEPPAKEQKSTVVAPSVASQPTAAEKVPQLLNITFDDSSRKGEMVLFHLTDFHPPAVSAVEKDNPMVMCDFMGMDLGKGVEEIILANGKYVERIATTKHSNPDKIRVTLNLLASRDYDLQQVFFKKDNLFVLIINELPPDKSAE
jgi:hypothetical protein